MRESRELKVKYFVEDLEELRCVPGSDWVDLRAAEDVTMKAGEFRLIPLGIAVALPEGYEAHVVPRSSTFRNYGLLQANSMGVVDGSYRGTGTSGAGPPTPPGMCASRKTPGFANSALWRTSPPWSLPGWSGWRAPTGAASAPRAGERSGRNGPKRPFRSEGVSPGRNGEACRERRAARGI